MLIPIPPRPFFRTDDRSRKASAAWSQYAAQGAKAVLAGKLSAFDVMDGLGERGPGRFEARPSTGSISHPPLSPITLELRAMKHKDPNLRITGTLVGQVAGVKVKQPGYQPASGNAGQTGFGKCHKPNRIREHIRRASP